MVLIYSDITSEKLLKHVIENKVFLKRKYKGEDSPWTHFKTWGNNL